MKRWGIAALVVTFILAVGPAHAKSMGTITPMSNATDIAGDFEGGWDAGQWECQIGSPTLFVWPVSGGCVERQATTGFTVTSGGGITTVEHTFEYDVFCNLSNTIQHTVRFDDGPVTPIDSGTFDFTLTGGDTLQLVTTEGPMPGAGGAPAMGRGAMLAAAAAVSLGLFWLLRRR